MPSMKKIFKALLFAACFFAVERFCHKETRGFSLPNIYGEEFEGLPTSGELPELIGPFTFLDSGLESYVFLSADKKVVLKFFKHHHLREADRLAKIFPFCKKMSTQKRENFKRSLSSYQIAYNELKEETALLYLHLAKTEKRLPTVTLIDRLGIEHKVALDQVQFLAQRRADLLLQTLDSPQAKESISSLLSLISTRSSRGIADRDPMLERNFGFIDSKAVVIDLGSFSKDPFLKKKNRRNTTLFYETLPLRCLLAKEKPDLLPHFEKEFERIISHEDLD